MPELLHHAYTILRGSMNHDNILNTIGWLSEGEGDRAEIWSEDVGGKYGEWSSRIRQDV